MYMGMGVGHISSPFPDVVLGIDVGIDIMGGISVPLYMKETE